MENIQRHNEFVFYIQIEKVLFWSWIWQINIIQKTLLHQVIIGAAVPIYSTSAQERNWSFKDKGSSLFSE